jgi:NADH-quinone oxidoreductase subunit D
VSPQQRQELDLGKGAMLMEEGGELVLNMGPHHPSTHGVLRFVLKTDGEVIRRCIPDVGFLHRSIEKISEDCTYPGFMPYTDRVDYLASMLANHCWAGAVEKLLGIEPPKRALYLRVIADELNRYISHLIGMGALALDVGATTPFLHMMREREYVNNLIEELCGQRITYHYHRIGGVAWDLPQGFRDRVLEYLDHAEQALPEIHRLLTRNRIFVERTAHVGVIPAERAISYGLVGPNLRASGVDYDLRRDEPYGAYPELDFDVCVGKGEMGTVGDSFDRYQLRFDEMVQSINLVRQALLKLPAGNIKAALPRKLKAPAGEHATARIESARGGMLCWVVAGGKDKPWRSRFRTGSFNSMAIIEEISEGMMIADVVVLIASLDVLAPEVDR